MKQSSNGLFWGVVLLAFGLVLLAKTLGWFHIDWGMTLRLWPLLLVAAGVSLLLRQSWSSVLTAILIAIAIPAAIINGTNKKWKHLKEEGIEFNLDEDWDNDDDNNDEYEDRAKSYSKDGETRFMEGFTPETKEATLKFGAGAGKFTIEGTTDQLIDAEANTEFGSYILTNKRNEADKSHDLRLEMESKDSTKIRLRDLDDANNRVDIRLNTKPVWTFDLGLGAGKGTFDLRDYKVKKVKIGAGAAEVKLNLGENVENNAEIDIEAGVASIKVNIPESVGCELKIDGALNAKDFDNFEKISDGLYRTSGYATAKKKIQISYEGGLSKIEVNRD